jgi:hypothetical protein
MIPQIYKKLDEKKSTYAAGLAHEIGFGSAELHRVR